MYYSPHSWALLTLSVACCCCCFNSYVLLRWVLLVLCVCVCVCECCCCMCYVLLHNCTFEITLVTEYLNGFALLSPQIHLLLVVETFFFAVVIGRQTDGQTYRTDRRTDDVTFVDFYFRCFVLLLLPAKFIMIRFGLF